MPKLKRIVFLRELKLEAVRLMVEKDTQCSGTCSYLPGIEIH